LIELGHRSDDIFVLTLLGIHSKAHVISVQKNKRIMMKIDVSELGTTLPVRIVRHCDSSGVANNHIVIESHAIVSIPMLEMDKSQNIKEIAVGHSA